MLLAGLSTGHKIGLAVVAAVFIGFALVSSWVVPRRRPDFPGRAGLGVYAIACFVLFAAMITAVEIFGAESETAKASEQAGPPPTAPLATFQVQEQEYAIVMPAAAQSSLAPGTYRFVVHNTGTLQHDLAIQLEGSQGVKKTPVLPPGQSATLTVTLAKGVYDLYSTVPGQRQAGMEAKVTVR